MSGFICSNQEYQAIDAVSNSRMKDFICDPHLYWYKHLSGRYRQPYKKEFEFGQAVHDLALLGDEASISLIPSEVLSKSGAKIGKAWQEWSSAHAGQLQLKQREYDSVRRCVDAVYSHPVASKFLCAEGVSERSFVVDDPETGLKLKSRVDRLCNAGIVVDLKTSTTGTQPAPFAKQIANFGYHYQEYFYRKVLTLLEIEVAAFVFVAVAVDEPHTVAGYTLDSEFLYEAERVIEPMPV